MRRPGFTANSWWERRHIDHGHPDHGVVGTLVTVDHVKPPASTRGLREHSATDHRNQPTVIDVIDTASCRDRL